MAKKVSTKAAAAKPAVVAKEVKDEVKKNAEKASASVKAAAEKTTTAAKKVAADTKTAAEKAKVETKKAAEKTAATAKKAAADTKKAAEKAKADTKKVTDKAKADTKKVADKAEKAVKTTKKRAASHKASYTSDVIIQRSTFEATSSELVEHVKEIWTKEMGNLVRDLKDIKVYVNADESMAYYVINGDIQGKFAL